MDVTKRLTELHPLDKSRNADKRRVAVQVSDESPASPSGISPLLASQIKNAERSGMAPAYLPLAEQEEEVLF